MAAQFLKDILLLSQHQHVQVEEEQNLNAALINTPEICATHVSTTKITVSINYLNGGLVR